MKHRHVYLIIVAVIIIFVPIIYLVFIGSKSHPANNDLQSNNVNLNQGNGKIDGDVDEIIVYDTASNDVYEKLPDGGIKYRNYNYGFEVQYPNLWDLSVSYNRGEFWIKKIGDVGDFSESQIGISVKRNGAGHTLQDVVRKKSNLLLPFYDDDIELVVNNEAAIQSRVVKPDEPPITPFNAGWIGGLFIETKIIHGNYIYTIHAVGEDYAEVEEVYDNLLKNFVFIR